MRMEAMLCKIAGLGVVQKIIERRYYRLVADVVVERAKRPCC